MPGGGVVDNDVEMQFLKYMESNKKLCENKKLGKIVLIPCVCVQRVSVYTVCLCTACLCVHRVSVYTVCLCVHRVSLCTPCVCVHRVSVYTVCLCTVCLCVHRVSVYTVCLCTPCVCVHRVSVYTVSPCTPCLCVHCVSVYTMSLCTLCLCVQRVSVYTVSLCTPCTRCTPCVCVQRGRRPGGSTATGDDSASMASDTSPYSSLTGADSQRIMKATKNQSKFRPIFASFAKVSHSSRPVDITVLFTRSAMQIFTHYRR